MLVEYIAQVYDDKYKDEYTIDSLHAFTKVTIRLIAPNKGDKPAECAEGSIKSTDDQLVIGDGTWKVHPVLIPPSINIPANNNDIDSGTIQELKAFNLGNIISVGLGIEGMDRLPNPPINKGMIIREIVNIPWKVIHGLCWRVGLGIWPGRANSNLIVLDDPIPVGPPIKPGNRCNAPISIWLVTGTIRLRISIACNRPRKGAH